MSASFILAFAHCLTPGCILQASLSSRDLSGGILGRAINDLTPFIRVGFRRLYPDAAMHDWERLQVWSVLPCANVIHAGPPWAITYSC